MAKIKRRKRKRFAKPPRIDKSITFSYKRFGELERFVSEQGYIIPRVRTGLSQKQQRRLSLAIKRARHLALLPFTQTLR